MYNVIHLHAKKHAPSAILHILAGCMKMCNRSNTDLAVGASGEGRRLLVGGKGISHICNNSYDKEKTLQNPIY